MREGQNFVMHLRMWNKETEVNTCQTYSQKKLRNAEFARVATWNTYRVVKPCKNNRQTK